MKIPVAPVSALALLFGACAHPSLPTFPSAPLSAESVAAAHEARSLLDPALRRFLVENTSRAPETWDFESLAWVAFYYHPSLAVARAQWATTRAALQTAQARPNPTISLVPGFNSSREPGLSPWFPSINFDFLFPTSAKRVHQAAVATAESEAAQLTVVSAAWQVRTDLRRALYEAAASTQREQLLLPQAAIQQKILTLLQARVAAGRAAVSELAAARTAVIKLETALAEARSQTAAARIRVAIGLGLPAAALDGITLPLPPASAPLLPAALAEARRQSLRSRADVLAALAHYQSVQTSLQLEVERRQPDVHLGPGYQWDQGTNKWSLALTFELPLFHRNEGPVAEAAARRAEAAAQFSAVQSQAIAAVDLAVAAQTSARRQSEQAAQLAAELHRQADAARRRFELGSSDQLELQTSLLEQTAAETAALESTFALTLASGQLEDALQLPFPHLSALADSARPHALPSP